MGSACDILAIAVANRPVILPSQHFVMLKNKITGVQKKTKTWTQVRVRWARERLDSQAAGVACDGLSIVLVVGI